MRKIFPTLLLLLVTAYAKGQIQTPLSMYRDLFKAVQMQSVFSDGKTFVDCTPKLPPKEIVSKYEADKNNSTFNLKKFVLQNFNLPEEHTSNYHSDISEGVVKHIDELWNVLRREPDSSEKYSSLLPLPYPYIVPGGRFREIYYWDSYFTMLGLQTAGKTDMVENMVKNFAYLINKYGFIPNGNRSYYLTRSQPPFFSLMVEMLAKEKGDYIYAIYLPALLKEYRFWMSGFGNLKSGANKHVVKMPDGSILNRYWDAGDYPREESWKEDVESGKLTKEPLKLFYRNLRSTAESGWDFSSRWFADGKSLSTIRTTDIVPVDLNCLLYHLEMTIARGYKESGNLPDERLYQSKAMKRKESLLKYCWNSSQNFFCDYLIAEQKYSSELTLAGAAPLFFKIATSSQAKNVQNIIRKRFLKPGGVVATLKNTGQQWDAPNGWAPLEYMTIEGLNNYGYASLAKETAIRWINLNIKVFKNTGKLMEKYNVENINLTGGGGEYSLQDGFGWTNGVLLKLMNQYNIKQ
ncbi:MAG: alpha,alpha-trehalase TreF [Chitinophagaceae bacterium]